MAPPRKGIAPSCPSLGPRTVRRWPSVSPNHIPPGGVRPQQPQELPPQPRAVPSLGVLGREQEVGVGGRRGLSAAWVKAPSQSRALLVPCGTPEDPALELRSLHVCCW